jgi:hypothetical protein
VLRPDTDMTTRTSDRHMIPRRNQRLAWMAGCSWSGTAGAVAGGGAMLLLLVTAGVAHETETFQ